MSCRLSMHMQIIDKALWLYQCMQIEFTQNDHLNNKCNITYHKATRVCCELVNFYLFTFFVLYRKLEDTGTADLSGAHSRFLVGFV